SLDNLFQTLFGAPIATVRVGMKPLYEFLIPRLYLLQGGGWLQLHRLQRNELKTRQFALRRTRFWAFRYVRKYAERVDPGGAVMPVSHACAALADRPCRAVSGERVDAKRFDLLLAHAGEEVPMLVVLARMRLAEPEMFAQVAARFWNLVRAFAEATGAVALARGNIPNGNIRLDPDVAFETRFCARAFHASIMGSERKKTRKRIA
ncbi:MAG TPA: hypothetical protein VLT91_14960, partial [Rhizomicrobium sp.]|nr:hypothetical protein [Rhizomicrobium sp.]